MTHDQQIKVLKSPKSSKELLREALSASLGVEYERPTKEKEITLITQCRDVFIEAYRNHTGLDYSFEAKDGRALSQITCKIVNQLLKDNECNEEKQLTTFKVLIDRLPEWYKLNAFSLTVINSKFNEIVASIKKNEGKGQQQGVSDSYKKRIVDSLRP